MGELEQKYQRIRNNTLDIVEHIKNRIISLSKTHQSEVYGSYIPQEDFIEQHVNPFSVVEGKTIYPRTDSWATLFSGINAKWVNPSIVPHGGHNHIVVERLFASPAVMREWEDKGYGDGNIRRAQAIVLPDGTVLSWNKLFVITPQLMFKSLVDVTKSMEKELDDVANYVDNEVVPFVNQLSKDITANKLYINGKITQEQRARIKNMLDVKKWIQASADTSAANLKKDIHGVNVHFQTVIQPQIDRNKTRIEAAKGEAVKIATGYKDDINKHMNDVITPYMITNRSGLSELTTTVGSVKTSMSSQFATVKATAETNRKNLVESVANSVLKASDELKKNIHGVNVHFKTVIQPWIEENRSNILDIIDTTVPEIKTKIAAVKKRIVNIETGELDIIKTLTADIVKIDESLVSIISDPEIWSKIMWTLLENINPDMKQLWRAALMKVLD